MKHNNIGLKRRTFLVQSAAAVALAAALPVANFASQEPEVSKLKKSGEQGYRLTSHIKKYYETISD